MDNDKHFSRARKFKKRRSVTRLITIFSLLGVLLVIGLILMITVGNKDQQVSSDDTHPTETNLSNNESIVDEETDTNNGAENESELTNDTNNETNDETNDNVSSDVDADTEDPVANDDDSSSVNNKSVKTSTVPAEDPNVLTAYEGDWQPIGTQQSEPHDVKFNKDSVDWAEMVAAIESVVDIDPMTIHWLGNGGVQKAIGTVSAPNHADVHRVYLSWVPEQGWQPTRVEQLERLEIIKYQSSEKSD